MGAIYQVPPFCVLATCLAAVALGIGPGALDDFERRPATSIAARLPGGRPRFDDDQISQLDLGRAEVRLRAARLLLADSLAAPASSAARIGAAPDRRTRRVGCREAAAAAVHAVDVACQLAGSASVREGNSLERRRRDIDTLRKHQVLWPNHEVPLGRQIAGSPGSVPLPVSPPDPGRVPVNGALHTPQLMHLAHRAPTLAGAATLATLADTRLIARDRAQRMSRDGGARRGAVGDSAGRRRRGAEPHPASDQPGAARPAGPGRGSGRLSRAARRRPVGRRPVLQPGRSVASRRDTQPRRRRFDSRAVLGTGRLRLHGDVDVDRDDLHPPRRRLPRPAARRRRGDAREALSLWRGDTLADVRFAPFARTRTRRVCMANADQPWMHASPPISPADVTPNCSASSTPSPHPPDAGTAVGPLDGRPVPVRPPAKALRAYATLRTTLAEQIGLDPSPTLRDLERAILEQRPELSWPVESVLAPARQFSPVSGFRRALER